MVAAAFRLCLCVCCSILAAECYVCIAWGCSTWVTVSLTRRREFSPTPRGFTVTAEFTTWRQLHISSLIYFSLPSLPLSLSLFWYFLSVLCIFPPHALSFPNEALWIGGAYVCGASEFWQKGTRCYQSLGSGLTSYTSAIGWLNSTGAVAAWCENRARKGWKKQKKRPKKKAKNDAGNQLSTEGGNFIDGRKGAIWLSGSSENEIPLGHYVLICSFPKRNVRACLCLYNF